MLWQWHWNNFCCAASGNGNSKAGTAVVALQQLCHTARDGVPRIYECEKTINQQQQYQQASAS